MTIFYYGGCLLPFIFILNLFLGWIFWGFKIWLVSQLVILLLLVLYGKFLKNKILSELKSTQKQNDDIIDIDAEHID